MNENEAIKPKQTKRVKAIIHNKYSTANTEKRQQLSEEISLYVQHNAGITDRDPILQQAALEAIQEDK